jgi:hypothetical protein
VAPPTPQSSHPNRVAATRRRIVVPSRRIAALSGQDVTRLNCLRCLTVLQLRFSLNVLELYSQGVVTVNNVASMQLGHWSLVIGHWSLVSPEGLAGELESGMLLRASK